MPPDDQLTGQQRTLLGSVLRNSEPFGMGILAEQAPNIGRLLQTITGQPSFMNQLAARNQSPALTLADAVRQGVGPSDISAALSLSTGTLPGWSRNGPNTPFEAQNFPHTQYVRVSQPAGPVTPAQTWVDAVRGLNQGHALSRARYNWEGAAIEPLTEAQARALDPSLFGGAR